MAVVELTISDIRDLVGPIQVKGAYEGPIGKIASLDDACSGDLSFLGNPKYKSLVASTKASIILLPETYEGEPGENQLFFFVKHPSLALDQICRKLELLYSPRPAAGVHPAAVVDPTAKLGEGVHVGPCAVVEADAEIGAGSVISSQAYVGRGARVGQDCLLKPRATLLDHCTLGDRVILHSGTVLGGDGFGYETVNGRHEKSPQIGIVEIHNDVEIGANSCIDRARFGKTIVGEGTKIDNLVQLGHNVVVGKHCFLASGAGISGSTKVGNYVVMGGQCGAAGHIEIGDFAQIGGGTGVTADVAPKTVLFGYPAMPYMQAQKFHVLRKKLPELFRRVDSLEKHLKP